MKEKTYSRKEKKEDRIPKEPLAHKDSQFKHLSWYRVDLNLARSNKLHTNNWTLIIGAHNSIPGFNMNQVHVPALYCAPEEEEETKPRVNEVRTTRYDSDRICDYSFKYT